MGSEQCLAKNIEHRIILQFDINRCSGVKNTFVYNFNPSKGIINRIIGTFDQLHPTGGYHNRTLGNIHCVE